MDFCTIAASAGAHIRMLLNKEAHREMQFNYSMMDEGYGPFNYIRLGKATGIVPMVLKEVGQLIENI